MTWRRIQIKDNNNLNTWALLRFAGSQVRQPRFQMFSLLCPCNLLASRGTPALLTQTFGWAGRAESIQSPAQTNKTFKILCQSGPFSAVAG